MPFKYHNTDTNEDEEIEIERWAWVAKYKDGSELHQFDKDGVFHKFAEINQAEVAVWVLYNTEDESKRIDIVCPDNAQLIHRYRNIKPYWSEKFIKCFMFGIEGKLYNFVLPDDNILQSTVENIDLTRFLT